MAKSVHNNWYQRRSIRGGRRHAGDRAIQNLYSDGVLESKTSSIRGPHIAGTRPDLQNDFTRVISLMEGLITRINNNIAHQAQFAKQSQEKYLESKKKFDVRWEALLKRSKNDLKAAHSVRKAVDLEKCDDVATKTDEHEDSTEIEDAVTYLGFSKEKNTEEEERDSANLKSEVRKLARKSQATVWGCGKMRKQRRRGRRGSTNLPVRLAVALPFCGGYGGAESQAEVRMWWWRKLRNHGKEKRAAKFRKNAMGGGGDTVGGGGDTVGGCGDTQGGCDGAVGENSGGNRSTSTFVMVKQVRANDSGVTSKVEEEAKFPFEGCWDVESRVRGKKVKGPYHDIIADVINSNFCLILLLAPTFHYNMFQDGPTHIFPSLLSLGILIMLGILAQLTFYPP